MVWDKTQAEGFGEIVTAGTLDAEVTSLVMDVRKLHKLTIHVDLTRTTLTAVIMSMDSSMDGSAFREYMNQDETAPDKALAPATWTRTTSVTESWALMLGDAEMRRLPGPFMRLRFNGAGGAVTDLITVNGYAEA